VGKTIPPDTLPFRRLYFHMNQQKTVALKIPRVCKDIPEADFSSLPLCCGAYVIKVKSGKLYVGSSKTIRSRVKQHKDKLDPNISRSDPIVSACYYQTETHVEARIAEQWLIREINPALNKTNHPDTSERGCDLKCGQNCETWEAPVRSIEINLNIVEECRGTAESSFSELPQKSGVYVITTGSGEQYVGSSGNVCARVNEHSQLKGENIQEPIASAHCYITENRTDAYLLEYAKIRELKPKLNREFRKDAWTWKLGELSKHFKEGSELGKIFQELRERILSEFANHGIKEVVRKDRVTYQVSALKNIFFVRFMSKYLRVDLKDPENLIEDTSGFSIPIIPTQSDIFHRRFQLKEDADIEPAMNILSQALDNLK
jgi:predicted GIY-YIG superfamily endonuclease